MRKQIEVRIPTRPEDLRIRHFKSRGLAPLEPILHGDEGLHFLSAFTGLKNNQLLDFTVDDIKKMVATAVGSLSRLDLTSKLPNKIKLAGTSYCLVDPDKVGIGWHIDFRNCDINKDPVRMACLFYLQEGFNYSDVDENDNIKFPISSRYKVFEENFPLDLFIRSCGFFLRRSLRSIKKSTVIEANKNLSLKDQISLAVRQISHSNGRQQLKP